MMLRMLPINDECTRVCRCRERRAFLSELLSEFVVRSGWDGLERGAGASFNQLEIPSIESCTAQRGSSRSDGSRPVSRFQSLAPDDLAPILYTENPCKWVI